MSFTSGVFFSNNKPENLSEDEQMYWMNAFTGIEIFQLIPKIVMLGSIFYYNVIFHRDLAQTQGQGAQDNDDVSDDESDESDE